MPEDLFATSSSSGSLLSSLMPREIEYFGTVKRKTLIPMGALFASLLFFTRKEQSTLMIPPHVTCKTRSEATLLGREGPCVDDIQHFSDKCRTQFANFPAIKVGTQWTAPSEGSILGQRPYKLGMLNGPWQGSSIVWRFPLSNTLELMLISNY